MLFWLITCICKTEPYLAVGIDLGTTFTSVGVMDSTGIESFEIIDIEDGKKSMPSVVSYGESVDKSGKTTYHPIVGWYAVYRNDNKPDPNNYAYAFKRIMGINTWEEYQHLIEGNRDAVSYEIEYNDEKSDVERRGFRILMKIDNKVVKRLSPIEASAFVLDKVKSRIDELYPDRKKKYLITYPAYFHENQVSATRAAAVAAGMEVEKFVHEPVAAATAYQRTKEFPDKPMRYLVFDFGGGTLDVTLVDYEDQILEAAKYSGSAFLGGENVTLALYEYFKNELVKDKANLNERERRLLRNFAEKFKIELCSKQNDEYEKDKKANASFKDDFLYGNDQKKTFELTNSKFNEICKSVFQKVRDCIEGSDGILVRGRTGSQTISDVKKSIDKVVFVGGSTRIPYMRRFMGEIFGDDKLVYDLDPDTAVAEGATYFLGNFMRYFGDSSITTVDTAPFSLGIRVKHNFYQPIIPAGKPMPYKNTMSFTTTSNNQKLVVIDVAQGDRPMFDDNHSIGKFTLELAGDMPAGHPEIEVTLNLSKDRSLEVTAIEKHSGKEARVSFNSSDVSLAPEVVESMRRQKELNKEKDEEFTAKNKALEALESYIKEVEMVKEAPNLSAENKNAIDKALISVKMWIESEEKTADKQAIQEQHENLRLKIDPLLKAAMGTEGGAYQPPVTEQKENVRDDL
ncbi:Heat shock protein [Dictyocoela muelleri]|nr:Heat shock protein [Dictyocoela muelleri]